jgi:hypothetical protein
MVKYVCEYVDKQIFSVYTEGGNDGKYYNGIQKGKSYSDMIFLLTE